ncbi:MULTISPECIES: oxygen-independent coproporphyrinogen III oxidase [unclassified Herbaspirillum]|uniref:oxygen-independent coproporphyrinogen III oxidase n=1 Tax=unclassified Herbaspirillum TaxID=2624150 RepID=UPI00114E8791|nr:MULTISPECIES: oxygen-independent coproporphyrinogen III oxidase [unclassified Herbaspirillum]MBB5392008.1 oxygen-independent coproporphyrinogen-3 oxidase [Herbaspirillum sp. SJZ102]TQK13468.1 oxygen-independent coproporphyrinogen-3 oxidase [Herbaspirillum sp. SJZ130]TQK15471.1 oxygen-independent coproporphyrinogen-3 oxidase [Herbaspirillum sp. SJZ106]
MQVAHPSLTPDSASLAGMSKSVLRKMDQRGPRYTSYPTADRFSGDFAVADYLHAVADRRSMGAWRALSLYLHIPFCDTICYYCACNKIVTRNRAKAALYLSYLKREISMQGSLFSGMNQVEQLHFGGGTPTYLSDGQMGDLMAHIRKSFTLAPDNVGEYSIEIDPRTVSVEHVQSLRAQGFNRISLGVQDFDPEVQRAVNRVQSEEQTPEIIRAARAAGFRSVSIDLIYGLPKQNVMSMSRTLAKVVAASPDRIAVYNYAHMPQLFKTQRQINEGDLPGADSKLDMLSLCIRQLSAAGYVYIGMDHFAKPADDLAVAQRQGRLHRNFQGYSTHSESDLVACGVSAISAVGGSYSQNEKTLDDYYARLESATLPIARGIRLGMDDVLRRLIIQRLMCNFELSISSLEIAYPIVFREYFAAEMEKLQALEADGLLRIEPEWITVEPKGRLLIRNICMVFDRYLAQDREQAAPQRYSQTL